MERVDLMMHHTLQAACDINGMYVPSEQHLESTNPPPLPKKQGKD